jgi:hypothetical protein
MKQWLVDSLRETGSFHHEMKVARGQAPAYYRCKKCGEKFHWDEPESGWGWHDRVVNDPDSSIPATVECGPVEPIVD